MEHDQPPAPPRSHSLIAISLRKSFNLLGGLGIVFIGYGVMAEATRTPWLPLEEWMNVLSSLFTLVGTLLTAGTVYGRPRQPCPPDRFSLHISAPLVMVGAIMGIGWLLWKRAIPISIVNGFAMLAMAGALFRIQPHTSE